MKPRFSATNALPDDLKNDPALMTRKEYVQFLNPGNKHHPSDSYDFDLLKLNRDNSLINIERVPDGDGGEFKFATNAHGIVVWTDEGKLAAVIHKGTLYYDNTRIGKRVPTGFWPLRGGDYEDWGVLHRKQVKYLSEVLPLVSNIARDNRKRFPVLMQRSKLKGDYYEIRAEKSLVKNAGTTISILNSKGEIVAQASDEWGATLLTVVQEYRSKGLGQVLGKIWYDWNPSFSSGGFTPQGEAAAIRRWESRVHDFLSKGWYSVLVKTKQLTNARVKEILSWLSGRRVNLERNMPEVPKDVKPKLLLLVRDESYFCLYDEKFYQNQNEDYIYGSGLFRSDPRKGWFLYSLEYDRKFWKLVTTIALQMAKNEGEPLYNGEGYGDLLELDGLQNVVQEGDYVQLTKDMVPIADMARLEAITRKKYDRYDEKLTLLMEMADSKW